ncbi:RimJ/RimL family protein N-acetyltransferase [Sphingomonas insulae]|uniref:GNAT family N-acetyltransferase n=1 Tax=Sphingomonas insulae TaxID=424800 RepID=A0ABN1HP29_9SPHN|nr:GNAT family N-acetyltransferase [Sphingomonas insulae]NIJ30756.1 RimJ/RimL family protein N-acetyltransferase [Sphingomonas insulae]
MFARTNRLTLRPAWPEDAPTLAQAIGHEVVTRMLMRVPFPYDVADAEAFCTLPRGPHEPRFLIEAHDGRAPTLIGGIAIDDLGGGDMLFGYWLTPSAWGRGYATEAGHAVVAMARHALPIDRLTAWHFTDNPASGAVLRKLGFRATGGTMMKTSVARREPAAATGYALDLAEEDRPTMRIAA